MRRRKHGRKHVLEQCRQDRDHRHEHDEHAKAVEAVNDNVKQRKHVFRQRKVPVPVPVPVAMPVRRVVGIGMRVPCLMRLAAHAHGMRCQDPCVRARMCARDRARARSRGAHERMRHGPAGPRSLHGPGSHSTARRHGVPCIDFISDASLSIASRSRAARARPHDATRHNARETTT